MTVTDPEQYRAYMAASTEAVARYGGKFVVRGGNPQSLEGDWSPTRIVIIEFDDRDQIARWYNSPEYRSAIALRSNAAEAKIVALDGTP